jgi:hypothetical protein
LVSIGLVLSEEKIFEKVYDGRIVKLQVLGNNSKTVNNIKNDQNSKIYPPCKLEVNLITHLGVIALFSSK